MFALLARARVQELWMFEMDHDPLAGVWLPLCARRASCRAEQGGCRVHGSRL